MIFSCCGEEGLLGCQTMSQVRIEDIKTLSFITGCGLMRYRMNFRRSVVLDASSLKTAIVHCKSSTNVCNFTKIDFISSELFNKNDLNDSHARTL